MFIGNACFAQEGKQATDELLDVSNQIERLIASHEGLRGEQELLQKLQIKTLLEKQSETISSLLDELSANPDYVSADSKEKLKQKLLEQYRFAEQAYAERSKALFTMRGEFEGLDGEPALKHELAIGHVEGSLSQLNLLKLDLIKWMTQLGVDTKHLKEKLSGEVIRRGKELSLLLNFANERIGVLVKEKPNATASEKEDIDLALRRLSIKRTTCTQALEGTVATLDALETNADYFKEVLITSTGAVSEDIFEVKVITRLLESWTETATEWFGENSISFTVKLIVFFAILFVFHLLSNVVRKVAEKAVNNSKLNLSQLLKDFFISMAGKIVFFIGVMIGLSQIGVQLAPLLAGFGVAGIVIGFALQGTLSNFASGMMILIYRPFDVGDMVIAGGVQGNVKKLSLVSATIQTIDNQRVVVPNNMIWNDVITNITAEKLRRVDMVFGISYSDDLDHAERVIHDVVTSHPNVLKRPEPVIKVANLGESSVDFWVRPWVKTEFYWDVLWDLTKQIKQRFDEEGICIPFPQRDVHLYPTALPVAVDVKADSKVPGDETA
ncbi:hypothetical protein GCM10025776_24370 [Corallincola platygyrae]